MVTEEEIIYVADVMRIEIDDHREHVDKVHAMIDYFDILDSAGVEDDELEMHDISVKELRHDEYIPYDTKLIFKLKNYKGNYIRAPSMS